jgi:fructose/tagatose bisphosphate aldolase
MQIKAIYRKASRAGILIPGFNIPYLPMMSGVIDALAEKDAFGLIMVARLEWVKFASGSPAHIAREYAGIQSTRHSRLHLDHVPVIDEDNQRVDYLPIIIDALSLGYDSVMVDGSRLGLAENIAATAAVTELAAPEGVAVEGELGAVFGHEVDAQALSYDELFRTRKGFTDIAEAARFARETRVDMLSVAVGNVHGPISEAARRQEKIKARIDVDHIRALAKATAIPLVLHGGSGLDPIMIRQAVPAGVVKLNIATDIRKVYEALVDTAGVATAVAAVKAKTMELLDMYGVTGSAARLFDIPDPGCIMKGDDESAGH